MKPFERFSRWGSKGISETAEAKYNSHISINSIARKASIWFISFPGCNESLKRILRFCLCVETITKYPFRTLTLSLRFWVATERAISKDSQLIGHESYSYSMSKSCINISFLSTVPRAFRIEFSCGYVFITLRLVLLWLFWTVKQPAKITPAKDPFSQVLLCTRVWINKLPRK